MDRCQRNRNSIWKVQRGERAWQVGGNERIQGDGARGAVGGCVLGSVVVKNLGSQAEELGPFFGGAMGNHGVS